MSRMADRPRTSDPDPWIHAPAWVAWIATAMAIAGIVFRVRLNFATDLAPSMDAAYYPMQAWWLLEHGRLMYQDMPLLFMVQAACGKGVAAIGRLPLDEALMLASRWVDCVVPPLIAFPTMALAMRWGAPTNAHERVACAAIGVAVSAALVAGPPALWMLGDFQKNAAALVLLACCVWAVQRGFDRSEGPSWRRWWPAAMFVLLTACTHAGTLGAALLIASLGAVGWVVLGGARRWRAWLAVSAWAGVATAVLLGFIWLFSPSRAVQLLTAPIRLLATESDRAPHGPGGPPPGDLGPPPDRMHRDDERGPLGPPPGMRGGPRPGMGGRPPGMAPPGGGSGAWLWGLTGVGGVTAIVRAWRDRRITLPTRSIGWALGASSLLLSAPLFGGEHAQRLSLMAAVPGGLAVAFALGALVRSVTWRWLAIAGATGLVVMTAVPLASLARPRDRGPGDRPSPGLVKAPVIDDETLQELRAVRERIDDPEHTLVVARHGLQWWAGHVLHTPVRNTVPEDAFSRYRRVLMLRENRSGPEGPFGRPRRPGRPPEMDGVVVFEGEAMTLTELSSPGARSRDDDPGSAR